MHQNVQASRAVHLDWILHRFIRSRFWNLISAHFLSTFCFRLSAAADFCQDNLLLFQAITKSQHDKIIQATSPATRPTSQFHFPQFVLCCLVWCISGCELFRMSLLLVCHCKEDSHVCDLLFLSWICRDIYPDKTGWMMSVIYLHTRCKVSRRKKKIPCIQRRCLANPARITLALIVVGHFVKESIRFRLKIHKALQS